MLNKKSTFEGRFFILVAGPGLEPGSGGYEPPEVPLLYPAILYFSTKTYSQPSNKRSQAKCLKNTLITSKLQTFNATQVRKRPDDTV